MPQIGAKSSAGVELLEIIQMEPLGKFKNNHNGNAKGGGVKDGNSWRRSHTGNMSEQDVDDVAFLTGPDSQSSRLARERAVYGGSSGGGGGRAVAVCSQKRALFLACSVLVVLLAAALVLAYAGPQSECSCEGEPTPGTKRGIGRPAPSPAPRLAVGGIPYPWSGARLPTTAEPFRYTLWLHPNLTTQEVKGEVIIEFHIEKETNFVILNARDLNITDKMVTSSKGHSLKILRFLEYKPADQIYFEIKDKFRRRGNYTLSLRYNTKLSKKPRGFFIADYVNKDGDKKQLAATNFGLTHARSAFPCFDEPQLKAKFKITIVRDRFHVSLTNMPIEATEEAGFYLGHRLLQDDFKESPEMSTYLVGLVVCEFARSAALAPRGTSVSVYADKRHVETAHEIMVNAVEIIDRYENFLNITFPLPKLDMVIMEGLEDTAEGWGLLGIGSTLLPDKKHLEKLLAHQWLGGLVTPKWWGSRWLTEGLVALLQHGPTETSFEDDTLLLEHTVPALRLDALPTSHPVSMIVQDPEDIEAVQDDLSYHKGAALVGMAWSAAGSGARLALRDFLSQYSRSAADPRDLWRLLGRKAKADLQVVMESWTEQAGYPLLTLSRDGDMVTVKQERFMLSADVPQTNMTTSTSLLGLTISMDELLDPSSDLEVSSNTTELKGILGDIQNGPSDKIDEKIVTTLPPPPKEHVKEHTAPHKKDRNKYRYRWYVPLTYILGPMENITNETLSTSDDSINVTTAMPNTKNGSTGQKNMKNMKQSPLDSNVQNSGNKTASPQKLTKGKNGSEGINNPNGTQLIWMNMTEVKFRVPAGVSWVKLNVGGRGLYRANYPEAGWTGLKKALSNGALSSPGDRASLLDDAFTLSRAGLLNASVALGLCEYLGAQANAEPARAPWRAALSHLQRWVSLLAGAEAGAPLRRHLAYRLVAPAARHILNGHLGTVGGDVVEAAVEFELPDAVKAAKKMFDDWVDKNVTVAAELRQAVYSAGVRHGAEDAWMKCWKAYKKSEDPAERAALLAAMATTPDHWLLNRYLQATLDNKLIPASDVKLILAATARRQPGRLLAWRHLRARPAPPPAELLEAVAEHMATPDDYKEVSEFYADVDVGPSLNRSLETIALNVAWVGKNERDLLKYLSQIATDEKFTLSSYLKMS